MNNLNKILILLLVLISQALSAKGLLGSYKLSGYVYQNNQPVCNQMVNIRFGDESFNIRTDSLGYYSFEVPYATACPSVVRGIKRMKANHKLNPKFVLFEFNSQQLRIRNKWNRYRRKGIINSNLKFK